MVVVAVLELGPGLSSSLAPFDALTLVVRLRFVLRGVVENNAVLTTLCFLLDRLGVVIYGFDQYSQSISTSAAFDAWLCDKTRNETRVGSAVVGLDLVGILRERRMLLKDKRFESNSRTVAVGRFFSNH